MKKNKQQTVSNVLSKFAYLLGTEVENSRLVIPEKFGKGYCAEFVFNEQLRMLIRNYELHEDLVIENPDFNTAKQMLFFKFQNIFPKTEILPTRKNLTETPSVLIATCLVNTQEVISIHSNTETIIIEVAPNYLNELFESPEKSPVLQSVLQNTQPLLFEQIMYPSLQKIIDEIVTEPVGETFELFFLRIKAEELICRLLMELEKRDEKHLYPLNIHDIQIIYKVKEQILQNLETPPLIKELAVCAGMSPSKLKYLFKQIFGNSIFSYYQQFRMKEAARLLKEEKLGVSDVGYQMGFVNLSHFTRVFEQHIGIKPKKYSTM